MTDRGSSIDDTAIADRLEAKAQGLDRYARQTTSRIVRAVSQGQAEILRECSRELRQSAATSDAA